MPHDDLTSLLADLVAVDSVNPSLVEGGAGEGAAADLVERWARAAGLEAERLEATPGRPSVLVRARGSGGGRTLLLCGHLDTVGVDGMTDPHVPRIEGDRLYGRGGYDMKAGVAAALIAARDAAGRGLAGDVVVAAVADEEHASLGVQEAVAAVRADAAIVTEPTELELLVAHKGFVWSEIAVTGRAAHGSRPHLGVDAIVKMGPVLTALGELDGVARRPRAPAARPRLRARLGDRGRRRAVEHPRLLHARRGAPDAPGRDRRRRRGGARRAARPLPRGRPGARGRAAHAARPRAVRGRPRGGDRDARRATPRRPELGTPPAVAGGSFWADSAFIAAAGIPTVLFGPRGEGAHAIEEWVSLSSTAAVARVLTDVATRFCA